MNKKGFTMIELLAAIVVMGILSVLAITGVTRLREKRRLCTNVKNSSTKLYGSK